ncbi:Excalibur calcium-binding domain-containing protein [Amycolatopsis marina]|uniref:Excalibur calcium-binding domain-containing protein n=1 Tax=Amycolatopsis marina TaxID=490629 RepID=A0A1I0W7Q6_9PSEU|nr:excalibur calcium-binding domain-containing protein [Amycolatopsis marina]SFA84300.1 Excalibur calcium-binding domain-containing protein [Amycolatopsis marina]
MKKTLFALFAALALLLLSTPGASAKPVPGNVTVTAEPGAECGTAVVTLINTTDYYFGATYASTVTPTNGSGDKLAVDNRAGRELDGDHSRLMKFAEDEGAKRQAIVTVWVMEGAEQDNYKDDTNLLPSAFDEVIVNTDCLPNPGDDCSVGEAPGTVGDDGMCVPKPRPGDDCVTEDGADGTLDDDLTCVPTPEPISTTPPTRVTDQTTTAPAVPSTTTPAGGSTLGFQDKDCGELTTQEARSLLAQDRTDPHHLDADNDGEPCEIDQVSFATGNLAATGVSGVGWMVPLGVLLIATGVGAVLLPYLRRN